MKVTFEKLVDVICDKKRNLNESDVHGDSTLKDELGLDSLDIVEIVVELEDIFDIIILDESYDTATTVDEFLKGINKPLKGE